ncbi:MAG: alpha/beta fold hydrolase [Pirellulales bacterium]|nr:alpha/beta fold hydrolase [Pirellulales bacterium]
MTIGQEVIAQVEQYQSGILKAIECNGVTVRYSDEGTGQPFLFLHHGGASHAVWSDVRERLRDEGRTIAIDFPGFGASDKPRRLPASNALVRYDLPLLVETVDHVIRKLELERPILVGNCMGSAAALAYALNFPAGVGGLLLCNVLTQATVEAGELRKLLKPGQYIPGLRWLLAQQFEWGAMPKRFQRWSIGIQLAPGQQLSDPLQETFEHLYGQPCQHRVLNNMGAYLPTFAKLDSVRKPSAFPPTWVVWGKHNRILPCDQGMAFCEQLAADRVEVLDSGHLPMVDRADEILGLLRELTAQVQTASPASAPTSLVSPRRLHELAQTTPTATAVVEAPSSRRPERCVDWRTLWQMANQLAWELWEAGLRSRDRVLLLVSPSPEFLALSHAISSIGASLVFIDGGLSPAAMADCIQQAKPTALVGIPRAHLLRLAKPRALASVRRYFSLATDPAPVSVKLLRDFDGRLGVPFPAVEVLPDSLAAIVFTSGSTGPPKGVEMSFRNFNAMLTRSIESIGDQYGDTALILYPLFLQIFSLMGRTSVLPDIDFSRPTAADPKHIVECIQRYKTTLGFSSPAILVRIAAYCQRHGISLDTMRVFFAAGAPIAYRQVIEPITSVMPNGRVITPYGATEALPVASIDSEEIRHDTAARTDRGAGICVGRPIEQVQVRIIPIADHPLRSMNEIAELPHGQIGEICVAGENVTLRYFGRHEQTAAAKIEDPQVPGGVWHRMGDVGYLDDQGRLWYCGRKKHRVACSDRTCFAQQPEGVADAVPGVFRSAFVGVMKNGRTIPVLVVEPEEKPPRSWDVLAQSIQNELNAQGFPVQREHILLHVVPFPVDPRHNAKIHREQLADWASEKLGLGVSQKTFSWFRRARGVQSWG